MIMKDAASNEEIMKMQLQKLGVRFVERSVADMILLRRHLEDARAGDNASLQQLERLVHRMHGTGATLGFDTVSDCAGEIEHMVAHHVQAGTSLDASTTTRLLDAMARLESELNRQAAAVRCEAAVK